MSRVGYTNLGPSQTREQLFEVICGYLFLDQAQHSARVQAINFALRVAALIVDQGNVERILRCRACAERLSGHPIPDRIPCATCDGTGEWIRPDGTIPCEDCQGRGWVSTKDWK